MLGLEPRTSCMQSRRSTTELHPLLTQAETYNETVLHPLATPQHFTSFSSSGYVGYISTQALSFMESRRSTTELHPLATS